MSRFSLVFIGLLAISCSKSEPKSAPVTAGSGSGSGSAVVATPPSDNRYDDAALGALTFQLSEGTPAARDHFRRGLLALHSFWYDEALAQFQAAIDADPTMNMAHWGLAMANLKLLWGEDDIGAAKQALGTMPDPDKLTDREQAWAMATIALITAPDVRSGRKAFVQALEQVNATYPDDESATFLAVALLSTTRPEDADNKAVRERAASLANAVFEHNPKHPGAAHYVIHALDTPELAPRALAVAKAYAAIAPEAFHAQHMPAHIFSRLGMWRDAITSCKSAWDASLAAAKRMKLSASHDDFHSLAWLVEMPFELGRASEAATWMKTFGDAVRAGLSRQHRAAYAGEVASYMVRTGDFAHVDDLLAPLSAPAADEPAPASASSGSASCHGGSAAPASAGELAERVAVLDTRAFAAAMRHDRAETTKLLAELAKAQAELRPALAATQPADTMKQFDASNARRKQTLLARASGDDRALVKLLQSSSSNSETGGENNPTAFVVQDEIGDALFRLGDGKGAAAAYAKALAEHPLHAHALLGAARAAAKLKDAAAERAAYTKLAELWRDADAGTDGLDDARRAITTP